jgi:hypothetical protein
MAISGLDTPWDFIQVTALVLFIIVGIRKIFVPQIQRCRDWEDHLWVVIYLDIEEEEAKAYATKLQKLGATKKIFSGQMDIIQDLVKRANLDDGKETEMAFMSDEVKTATRLMIDNDQYDPKGDPNAIFGAVLGHAVKLKAERAREQATNPLGGILANWPT